MQKEITYSDKLLNGFLSFMVVVLIGILALVVVCLILTLFGIL